MKKVIMFILTCVIRLFLLLVFVSSILIMIDLLRDGPAFRKNSLLSDGRIIYASPVNPFFMIYSADLKSRKIEILYSSKKHNSYLNKKDVARSKKKEIEGVLKVANIAEDDKGEEITGSVFINKLDSDWILLSIDDHEDDRIYKFNLKTKELRFLRNGSYPVYMAKHNKLVFFLSAKRYKDFDDDALCMVDMDELDKPKFIAKVSDKYGAVIPVSDSEILFKSAKKEQQFVYDMKKDKLKKLSFNNSCWAIGSRIKTGQLLCDGGGGYFFRGLDGKKVEKIDDKIKQGFGSFYSVNMYIPEKNLIVIDNETVRFASPAWDMWLYDPVSGKKEVLTRGISWRDAIYLPDKN